MEREEIIERVGGGEGIAVSREMSKGVERGERDREWCECGGEREKGSEEGDKCVGETFRQGRFNHFRVCFNTKWSHCAAESHLLSASGGR